MVVIKIERSAAGQRTRTQSDIKNTPVQLSLKDYEHLLQQLRRCYPHRLAVLGAALRASQTYNGNKKENAEKEKDLLLFAFATRIDPRLFEVNIARIAELINIEHGVEFIIGSEGAAPAPPVVPQAAAVPQAGPSARQQSDPEEDELNETSSSSRTRAVARRGNVRSRTSVFTPAQYSLASYVPEVRAAAKKRARRVAPTVAKRQRQAQKQAAISAALNNQQQQDEDDDAPELPKASSAEGEMMRILAAIGCGLRHRNPENADDDDTDMEEGLVARDRRARRAKQRQRFDERYQSYISDGSVNVDRAVGVVWTLANAVLKKEKHVQQQEQAREVIKKELWLRSEGGPCDLERLIYFVLAAVHDRKRLLQGSSDNLLLENDDKIRSIAKGLLKLVIGTGTLAILPLIAAASFRQTTLSQLHFMSHYRWFMRFNGSSYGMEMDELRDTFLLPVLSKLHQLLPKEWVCLSEKITLSHHTAFGAAVVIGDAHIYRDELEAWQQQTVGARNPLAAAHPAWTLDGINALNAPNAHSRPLVSHTAVSVLDGDSTIKLPYQHLGLHKVFNPETRPMTPLPYPDEVDSDGCEASSVRILVQHELVQPQAPPPQMPPPRVNALMHPPGPPLSTRASSPALSISESLQRVGKRIGSGRLFM